MIHSWFALKLSKKERFARKIRSFHHVFYSFSLLFPFLCPRANRSRRSLLCRSLLKSEELSSLFTKEWPWAKSSRCSLKKSKIAICSLEKSESLFRPFAHKKEWLARKTKERIPSPALHTGSFLYVRHTVMCAWTRRIPLHPRSICDRLGFYAEIQIIIGTVWVGILQDAVSYNVVLKIPKVRKKVKIKIIHQNYFALIQMAFFFSSSTWCFSYAKVVDFEVNFFIEWLKEDTILHQSPSDSEDLRVRRGMQI